MFSLVAFVLVATLSKSPRFGVCVFFLYFKSTTTSSRFVKKNSYDIVSHGPRTVGSALFPGMLVFSKDVLAPYDYNRCGMLWLLRYHVSHASYPQTMCTSVCRHIGVLISQASFGP